MIVKDSDNKNRERNNKLVKNSFILAFGTLIPKIIMILVLPLLTTYLTKEEYGNYDLIISTTGLIVPVITLQIQQAVFRNLLATVDKQKKEIYISTSIAFILLISVASIPITLVVGTILGLEFLINAIMCMLVVAESVYLLLGQTLRGIGKNINYSLGVIIYAVVNALLLVIFVYCLRLGLLGVALSITVAYSISAFSMLIIVAKDYNISKRYFKIEALKEMLSFSAPIVPSSISLWVVNLSDRLIIVHYLGAAANGIYSVANKIPALYSTAYNIFNLAWTEMAAQVADSDKHPELYYSTLFKKMYDFLVGVMLIIIAFSPLFYKIFVNEQYYDSYYQTAILYLGVFFNSLVMFYAGIYIAIKRTKQVGYSSIVGAIINIAVNLTLVRRYGLFAASVSTFLSYLAISVYRAIDINRFVKIRYNYAQIIIGLLLIIIASISYYARNIIGYCICFAIAIIYNIIVNNYIVRWMINRVLKQQQY